jgi:hypothetical protein
MSALRSAPMSAIGQSGRRISLATVSSCARNVGIAALNLCAISLSGSDAYAENLAATPPLAGASTADLVQSATVPSPMPTDGTPTRTISNDSKDQPELTSEAQKPVSVAQAAAASRSTRLSSANSDRPRRVPNSPMNLSVASAPASYRLSERGVRNAQSRESASAQVRVAMRTRSLIGSSHAA